MPKKHTEIFYFLLAMIFLNLAYPFSELGTWQAVVFQFAYTFLFALGIYIVRDTHRYFWLTVMLGIAIFLTGVVYTLDHENEIANILYFGEVICFQSIVIYALLEFIFATEHINRAVIYAAIGVYLLIGATFAPFYALIEHFYAGSFAINTGAPVTWQRLLYYSYCTLTTVGYGDITPVKPFAQAVASMEAVTGVLYVAILMARLVSLYVEEAEETQRG